MKAKGKMLKKSAIAALFLAAFIVGCKDEDVEIPGGLCPVVVSTDPTDLATGVLLNKVITATFNENMNPATITQESFSIMQGATKIAGALTYTGTTPTLSFDPTALLVASTTFTGRVSTAAKDLKGNSLQSDYVWTFTTAANLGGPTIDLKTSGRFGIFAFSTATNDAGPSEIHDLDVGIYPGLRSSLTGWFLVDGGPGLIFNGNFYAADDVGQAAMLLQAKNDANDAYLAAQGATTPAPATVAGDLGGQTLAPGIYKSATSLLIQSGNLTLDAQDDANAVWIFQIGSTLTSVGIGPYPSSTGGNVILTNGAQAKNVFWAVGSSATIGDFTSFNGNVLALTSATMNSGSRAVGRFLVQNGAVVLTSTNIINKP